MSPRRQRVGVHRVAMNDLSNTGIIVWLVGLAAVLAIVVVVLRSIHTIGAAHA